LGPNLAQYSLEATGTWTGAVWCAILSDSQQQFYPGKKVCKVKVFITGGTGLIGLELITKLLARGDDVVCLSRDLERAKKALPEMVELVVGNPVIPGDWESALATCDAVVNLAGEPVFDGFWTKGKKRKIRRSRLSTTSNIVDALSRNHQPQVLINASAVGYYGEGGEAALGENSEAGQGFLPRLACEWEHTAAQAQTDDLRVVIVRIGIVLTMTGGALPEMIRPYKLGLGGAMASGRQFLPWIHVDDLVRILLLSLDDADLAGPINAVVPIPPRQREFAQALGKALNKPAIFSAPGFLLKMVMGEKMELLLASQRVVPNVLKIKGFKFQFEELDDALADLIP